MLFALIGQVLGSVWAADEAAQTEATLVRFDLELQRKFQVIKSDLRRLQATAGQLYPTDRVAQLRYVAVGWGSLPMVSQGLYGPKGVIGTTPSAAGVAREVEIGGVVVKMGGTHESAIRHILSANPRVDQDVIAWILADALLWWPQ